MCAYIAFWFRSVWLSLSVSAVVAVAVCVSIPVSLSLTWPGLSVSVCGLSARAGSHAGALTCGWGQGYVEAEKWEEAFQLLDQLPAMKDKVACRVLGGLPWIF